MKDEAKPTTRKRHRRIRISSSERLTFWRTPQENQSNAVLECPFCGHEVFWVNVESEPDALLYEDIVYRSETNEET